MITNAGAFNNNSGATMRSFGTFTNDGTLKNNVGATFTNFGMLTSTQAIVNVGTLTNIGTLTVTGFSAYLTNSGSLQTVGVGRTLLIQGATVFNAAGTISVDLGARVQLDNLTTVQSGTLNTINGTLGTIAGAHVTLDGSTSGALTIKGTFLVDHASSTSILGTINNQGNIQVNSGSGADIHLTVQGDTTLQGGGTVTLANLGGGGTSFLDAAASRLTLTNLDNTIQGAGTIRGAGLGPVMQLVNQSAGTILANTPGQILAINGAVLTNAGTVQVNAGSTLQVIGPFIQTGGKTQVDGTMLAVLGENVSGGMVHGTGIINGSVTLTGGTIQPGSRMLPGTLTINGDFSHSAGLFNELIGSGGNGLLFVNGASILGPGSLLGIDLLAGFKPLLGETFTLMDFTSGSGIFANAPTAGFQMDGYNWTILYDTNSIVLDAGAPVETSTNVPEPNSLLLLSTALAALASSVWKKTAAATRA